MSGGKTWAVSATRQGCRFAQRGMTESEGRELARRLALEGWLATVCEEPGESGKENPGGGVDNAAGI